MIIKSLNRVLLIDQTKRLVELDHAKFVYYKNYSTQIRKHQQQ